VRPLPVAEPAKVVGVPPLRSDQNFSAIVGYRTSQHYGTVAIAPKAPQTESPPRPAIATSGNSRSDQTIVDRAREAIRRSKEILAKDEKRKSER